MFCDLGRVWLHAPPSVNSSAVRAELQKETFLGPQLLFRIKMLHQNPSDNKNERIFKVEVCLLKIKGLHNCQTVA